VIKQGEHGALLAEGDRVFKVPGYPLEEVFDPTGAGDAFAGGFMGHLARSGDVSEPNLRRAMVYGAAMGSFAVEAFGVQRFEQVTVKDVEERVQGFLQLTQFEVSRPGQ
jgi:sugar/nucleoside kinase (ribokinase family)